MRIVALLTVRNEELYLTRCLQHLKEQGVETCIIDNDSEDSTLEIAKTFIRNGVFRIERIPFEGYFDLQKILLFEEKLSYEIDADWFMHYDADEIREAPLHYTLRNGISYVDSMGYNAINFNEFVFLPTSDNETYEREDYVKKMNYYYFFEPWPLREIKAWKKNPTIDLHTSGGHSVDFEKRIVYPYPFIMRHYIVLSREHAIRKYTERIFNPKEVAMGWHRNRVNFNPEKLRFPQREKLKFLQAPFWDTSCPWKVHTFLGEE